mgnify:CR=1 FL=1
MTDVLMPKATAVWLVDNTTLTFDQIASFCNLHALEVQGIADGEVAAGIKGLDPIATGQLSQDEIDRCTRDAAQRLRRSDARLRETQRRSKGPRYTPLSRRQDRPNAIAWLVRYHPELTDAQVCKMVGTTKPTVVSVRDRSHWNTPNLAPQDPVSLGMCTQTELDEAVQAAAKRLQRKEDRERRAAAKAAREKEAATLAAQAAAAAEADPVPVADTPVPVGQATAPTPQPEETGPTEPVPEDVPDTALGAALARAGLNSPESEPENEGSGGTN